MKEKLPKNTNVTKIILLLLLIIVILVWQTILWQSDHTLKINILDVGQGDAIHFRKDNVDVLVDGGPDSSLLSELGKTMPFYDKTIEYIFLTHPDSDHVTGLVELLKSYNVDQIYLTGAVSDTAIFQEFLSEIESENVPVTFVSANDEIDFGPDYYFDILWPKKDYINTEKTNTNNTSIVGKLVYKNVSMLLTGDIENNAQFDLISIYQNKLKSDIIKIAHHGSKNATSENLLQFVNPEIALILVGADNKFGHPHQETLDLLEKFQTRTFRTDFDGTITIVSDGINFWKK